MFLEGSRIRILLQLSSLRKMLKLENVFTNPIILKNSNTLLKIRIGFYIASWVHLFSIATMLLSVDFNMEKDPVLQKYHTTRWRLITAWFNLLSLVYMPICAYCDWRELRGEANSPHIKFLNTLRYALFSSILLPTTIFADVLFWRLWNQDREFIAPASVDRLIPFWSQHCMHTVSLMVIILDLILVPRKRPNNLMPGIVLMLAFLFAYTYVLFQSIMQGEYIYPVLKNFSKWKFIVLLIYTVSSYMFYYTLQWFVNDLIWNSNSKGKRKIKVNLINKKPLI